MRTHAHTNDTKTAIGLSLRDAAQSPRRPLVRHEADSRPLIGKLPRPTV